MATAKSRASLGLTGGAEEGTVYGKRNNIAVPDADNADTTVATTIPTAAALRETDRYTAPNGLATSKVQPYAPDAADYLPKGSERTTN